MRHLPINYPGIEEYSVTEDGVVIGKDGVSKLSQFKTQRGYLQVGLYISGNKKRKFSVSRLVALTYVPTNDTTLDVDHIDGDKLNNHYTNLQWLTRSENVAKAFRQGRVGSRKGKLSGKLTGLYLTHEAIAILDKVENKSKYVSELIVTGTPAENTPSPKNIEAQNLEKNNFVATPDSSVEDLFAAVAPDVKFVEVTTSELGELPCCADELQPCKHWVWDSSTGEGYKNTLSGRFMEVE